MKVAIELSFPQRLTIIGALLNRIDHINKSLYPIFSKTNDEYMLKAYEEEIDVLNKTIEALKSDNYGLQK